MQQQVMTTKAPFAGTLNALRSGSVLRAAGGSLLLGLLSACGGGGSGGSGDGSVVVPPIATPAPTPTPSPTPTPTPAATGQVASVDVGTIPVGASDLVLDYKVTNAGLYMRVGYDDESKPDAIIKLRGTPAFSDAWYTTRPHPRDGGIDDYAPSNPYSETRSGVGFYWAGAGSNDAGETVDRWGNHVVNTGDISTFAEGPSFGFFGIQLVASGARSGIVASRPWVLWYQPTTVGISGYSVFQDDGAYTKPNVISDHFGTPATPPLPGPADIMLSHPDDALLFVGVGNTLYLYSPSSLVRSWTLPEPGNISDMMWADGALYFGQGSKIYRSDGATVRSVADSGAPLSVPGRFCISGGEIFLPSGEAIDLRTSARRNWLRKGQLTGTQAAAAQQLEIAVLSGAGVFCSSYAPATTIYVPSVTDHTVRVITPVAR